MIINIWTLLVLCVLPAWVLTVTKHVYECPCLPVCHTLLTMFFSWYHHENFQRLNSRSEMSKESLPVFESFRTITSYIHTWLWNDAQSFEDNKRGTLLFFYGHPSNFKVTWAKKSPIWPQFQHFHEITPVSIHRCLLSNAWSFVWHTRG